MALTQLATVDFLTSWCGDDVLRRNCFWPFLFHHASVTCRYDFMACNTQSFGFCCLAQNSTDEGGLPFLYLLVNLWKVKINLSLNKFTLLQSCIQYLNDIYLRLLMLLLKTGVRQVYEIILLLTKLNYLVIWRDNLKLSLYPKQKCTFI